MRYIFNLTQHAASAEQKIDGVIGVGDRHQQEVIDLITFRTIPSKEEMSARAARLAEIVVLEAHWVGLEIEFAAMIGGAPFFQSTLERALKESGIKPLHAFSERVVIEETSPTGETVKKSVFRHVGWVEV